MSTVTWNMQGGTNTTESKWVTFVTQLVNAYDVVCLQEAGALPASAVGAISPGWITMAPPAGFVWQYATWNLGTIGRPRIVYILWGNSDPTGNRVNLAVCSLIPPTWLLYGAPGLAGGRPSLGMQILGDNVYTLHAFSGGGGDAGGLITNINGGPAPWFALGDYNRDPTTWAPPAGVLCPPDGPTHQGGGKLDYMVKSAGAAQTGQVQTDGPWSDHLYVVY